MMEKFARAASKIVNPVLFPPEKLLREQVHGKAMSLGRVFREDAEAGVKELAELMGSDVPKSQKREIAKLLVAELQGTDALKRVEEAITNLGQ